MTPPGSNSSPRGPWNHAGFMLWQSARRGSEILERQLEPLGLKLQQFFILNRIAHGQELAMLDLGRPLGVDRTTMVKLADELEARDLVVRTRNPDDRRSVILVLTDAGEQMVRDARRAARAADAELLADLEPSEAAMLRALLLRIAGRPSPG